MPPGIWIDVFLMQFIKKNFSHIIDLLVILAFAAASFRPMPQYFPGVDIEAGPGDQHFVTRFLFHGQPTPSACDAVLGNIVRSTLNTCPSCAMRNVRCSETLSAEQAQLMGSQPLPQASGRMGNGVILFESSQSELALNACQVAQAFSRNSVNPITCFAAGSPRPIVTKALQPTWPMLPLFLVAALIAWGVCWLLVRYEHLHAHLSHDHVDSGPQKYHAVPTPRIGGLAIAVSLLITGSLMPYVDTLSTTHLFALMLLAGTPAFLGGLVEDVTKKVGVIDRLMLTMLAGIISAWLLGVVIRHLDMPGLDAILSFHPVAVIFTAVAVGGLANAINIIDGYNGLATGLALLILTSLGVVAYSVGDAPVFWSTLVLAGALVGFLRWNWPGGKIFLGDGGAYLLGFILAQLTILVVIRNDSVSPWFALQLLIHPIFETFFSIYRRVFRHGLSPGQPDNRHLHQLVHDYHVVRIRPNGTPLANNNRVAMYFWLVGGVTSLTACLFHSSSVSLISLALLYCLIYVAAYRWLETRPEPSPVPQGLDEV